MSAKSLVQKPAKRSSCNLFPSLSAHITAITPSLGLAEDELSTFQRREDNLCSLEWLTCQRLVLEVLCWCAGICFQGLLSAINSLLAQGRLVWRDLELTALGSFSLGTLTLSFTPSVHSITVLKIPVKSAKECKRTYFLFWQLFVFSEIKYAVILHIFKCNLTLRHNTKL